MYDYNTHDAMQQYVQEKRTIITTQFTMAQGTSWQCKQQATYQNEIYATQILTL